MHGPKRKPIEERFLEKVIRKNGECWEWDGFRSPAGYGMIYSNISKGPICAHRYSYEFYKGPIPNGMYVCHKCDNPECCNPDHLFIGTNSENIIDCLKKNRHPIRKLKLWTVLEIRRLYEEGWTFAHISRVLNQEKSNVRKIALRQTWKYV